jgi:hypothetical protein
MKSILFFLSTILLLGISITGTSCQKETDCIATVKCVDSAGVAVSGATVLLYAQVKDPNDPKGTNTFTADVKASGTSDGGGQVSFTFKLPAIFDVKATKEIGNKTYSATSIIKLEVGASVEKTISLK